MWLCRIDLDSSKMTRISWTSINSFSKLFRDKSIEVKEGEILIVPKGTEHKPSAKEEVHVLLFEPVSTLNTGNIINEFTKAALQEI